MVPSKSRTMRLTILCSLLSFVLRLAAVSAEGTYDVAVGGAKIAIPVPDQFADVGELKRVFPQDIGNRLLAWFAPAADIKEGKRESRRWMQVQVLKQLEDHVLTKAEFGEVAQTMVKQQDTALSAAKDEVNGILKKLSSGEGAAELKIGEVKPMGVYMNAENAFGMLMLMGIEAKTKDGASKPRAVYCGVNFTQIADRLIYVYVYGDVEDKDAAEWVKAMSLSWVPQILKANAK
jgi:hypothetical protein